MTRKPLLMSGLFALALTACAAAPEGPAAASRFDSFTSVQSVSLGSFDKIFVADVTADEDLKARIGYRPMGTSDNKRPITQRDLDRQLANFEADLKDALGRRAELVDAPGPGVLTVEVVATRLEANLPTRADLSANPGLSVRSRYTGGGSATVTFKENGQELATAEDSNLGRRQLDEVAPATWGEANQFYRRFSDKVSALLG